LLYLIQNGAGLTFLELAVYGYLRLKAETMTALSVMVAKYRAFKSDRDSGPVGNAQNVRDALTAAHEVMKPRLESFEKSHGRPGDRF